MTPIFRNSIFFLLFFSSLLSSIPSEAKSWLHGNWIGLKYQVNAYKKWQMTLTLDADKKNFTVYYPELECRGTLELVEMNEKEAILIEKISDGQCLTDGYIIIKNVDSECLAFICYRDNRSRLASYAVLQPDNDRYKNKDSWKKLNGKGTKLYADVFETMRQQAEKDYGKHHQNYAFALNNLALFYDNQVEYQKAFPLYQETAVIYGEVFGEKSQEYILALDNLAGFYRNSGRIGEAEVLYIDVLKRRRELLGAQHPNYLTSLQNLSYLYLNASNYVKAEPLFIEALSRSKEIFGEQSGEYLNAIFNLAFLYRYEGNFEEAKKYYQLALDLSVNTWGKKHINYISALESFADFYKSQSDYTTAETLTLEAIQIYKEDMAQYRYSAINSYYNMANIYTAQERYQEAATLLVEVLKVQKEYSGTNNPDYANSLNSLAIAYDRLGEYEKSVSAYIESSEIYKKVLGSSSLGYLISIQNLAFAYVKQNKFSEAEALYVKILPLASTVFGKNHLSYSGILVDIAGSYGQQKKFTEAEALYKEANGGMLSQIETNFSILSEKEKALFYNTFSYKFDVFNSFVAGRVQQNPSVAGEVYNNQLVTKALLFNTTNKMKERILASNDESLKTLFNEWQLKKEYLSKVYQMPVSEKEEQHIDEKSLEQEVNSIEKKLSPQSETFSTVNDHLRASWQEVQKKLKPKEAAIEMIRFGFYNGKSWTDTIVYMALIIKPGAAYPETVLLYEGQALESKYARYYNNAIRFKTDDTYSYLQYWKSIQDKLPGIEKVYFSPDGVYNQINLLTLKNPVTGKYLMEELDIQILSNTKDLLKTSSQATNAKEAVLIGFPDYNSDKQKTTGTDRSISSKLQIVMADTTQRFFNGTTITMLPGTKKEVENISRIFAKNKLKTLNYTEQEASEGLVKSLKNPRILHIATHGFFMRDVQTSSENERGLMGMDNKKVVENPLLRSGLLFANASKAFKEGGDGVLTSYEVMNLNLDETDLVVMSACETGLGEIKNGEGVYGLQRSFQTAGAKTVLMSLWTVSDAATQELMTLFYENWISQKQNKRQAFKNAQQSLKAKYPEPYYWGAFVMVGE